MTNMSIDVNKYEKGLDHKIKSGGVQRTEFKWGSVPDGLYLGELVTVFPWKSITKDTTAFLRDEENRLVKDEQGNRIKVDAPNLTWYYTDVVFKIIGGEYDGFNVKSALSTHPDMIGSANRFLYNAGLFDVSLNELKEHLGTKVGIHVKTKMDTFKDKNTGEDRTVENVYVSYYSKIDDKDIEENDLGI